MSTSISATEIGLPDDAKLKLGTGEDLEIYHDGTNTYLDNNTGQFNIDAASGNAIRFLVNGSYQCQVYTSGIDLPDSKKIRLGDSEDLQIYHDSTHSYLSNGTGNLFVEIPDGQKFQVQHGSEAIINGYADGRVEIYHDNSKKLETISTGLNVTGGVRLGGNNSANELDDYEEGTFTPLLSDNLSSGSASSYQNQSGHYTKVGNIVHIIGALRADNISNLSSSANLKIRGLPFVASDVTTGSGEPDMLLITFINNLSSDSNRGHVYGRIENGVAAAQLGYAFSTGQSAGNLLFSQINNGGNNTYFTFSGTYRTG